MVQDSARLAVEDLSALPPDALAGRTVAVTGAAFLFGLLLLPLCVETKGETLPS